MSSNASLDIYNLQRFIEAQAGVYGQVLSELRAGQKQSHWMWFIFPQIKGLGSSPTAKRYAIQSMAEARAYLDHPLLSSRLRECAALVLAIKDRSAMEIFGYPDNLKLHSSLTLFAEACTDETVFRDCLKKYFLGERDLYTMEALQPAR